MRRATNADLPALVDLRRSWTAELDGHHHAPDPGFEAAFADWWVDERERRTTWLAARGTTVVGMINLVEFRRMPRPGRSASGWGYVGNLYVRPGDRRKGTASALVAALLDEARRRGYQRVVVNPSDAARALFERAGFGSSGMLRVLELLTEGD